jgi:predicted DNA-binding protein YlxM (UPF0122 family)
MTNQQIIKLYKNGISLAEIGTRAGISRQAVQQKLKRLGVERRDVKDKMKTVRKVLDEQILRDLYLNHKLSYRKIEKWFGVKHTAIIRNLKEYGIPIRTGEDAGISRRSKTKKLNRKTLKDLYHEKGLSTYAIAEMYDVSQSAVMHLIEGYKLQRQQKKKPQTFTLTAFSFFIPALN